MPGPNPPTGSALPDFTSGPIIPNSVLPIEILGDVYRNGILFQSGAFDFTIPPSSADGRSHFIGNFWADTGPASSDLIGMYEYRLTVRDNQNPANGYNISAQFNIAPEPGTLSLFGVCIMGLAQG